MFLVKHLFRLYANISSCIIPFCIMPDHSG